MSTVKNHTHLAKAIEREFKKSASTDKSRAKKFDFDKIDKHAAELIAKKIISRIPVVGLLYDAIAMIKLGIKYGPYLISKGASFISEAQIDENDCQKDENDCQTDEDCQNDENDCQTEKNREAIKDTQENEQKMLRSKL